MKSFSALVLCLFWAVSIAAVAQDERGFGAQDLEFFEKQVRPVLATYCFECHGPDRQRSNLRLDHISLIMEGGSRGPVLAPGDLMSSRIVEVIEYENVDLQMPPNGKLPAEAIESLKEWIRLGAPWPDEPIPFEGMTQEAFDLLQRKEEHWAWSPVAAVEPPTVVTEGWGSSAIDRFVLAKLEEAGLSPAGPADKRTLLRRVYFDLIGLPPTPEAVEAFVKDSGPDAFEKVVDSLLASPAFGERWSRHWMDLMRFAESYGHEQDYPINHAWQYRDYLIRAFNDDVPYDQLVMEHLAGDLLDAPRRHPQEGYDESIIGTGFWYMHQATHAPVDPALDEAERIDNQIDVMSKAFLGMTVSCARCHDHKFDAISEEDYYSLTAYLRAARQDFAFLDPGQKIASGVKELKPLHREGSRLYQAALQRVADGGGPEVAAYLLGARDVIHGSRKPMDGEGGLRPEVIFEDFEGGAFEKWEVEGEAFGESPATGAFANQQPVEGFLGQGFANSFAQGDRPRGTLRSKPFVIERDYIRFLIGGGAHARRTKFVLKVNGDEVRRASGRNQERLEGAVWDVREFAGKTGTLEIIDDHEGSWGHINLDHIVFTDMPYRLPAVRPASEVARERGLDAARLERWVHGLMARETEDNSHPLRGWVLAMDEGAVVAPPEHAEGNSAEYVVYETFEGLNYEEAGWFTSGYAFGARAADVGDWRPAGDVGELPPAGTAHSGLLSDNLQGVLRSPTFTINHENIHFRVAGQGGRVRLVVSRYELREFNPLLFDTTLFDVNTGGEFEWRTMRRDVRKWLGRQAYFEFSDENEGYIAVDRIVFSDSPEPPRDSAYDLPGAEAGTSLEELAKAYEASARSALKAWTRGDLAEGGELLRWLLLHDLVDLDDARVELTRVTDGLRAVGSRVPEPMRVLAMTDGTPEPTHVFIRGDVKALGNEVEPRFLEALAEYAPKPERRSRLDLAEAILNPENPLTSRVAVNRLWHHLFGRGIVPSVDNFGVLGELPSHPELLDYLATEFRENGWSLKEMIRTLMLTSTYQMSSAAENQVAEARDPANVLLHRMNVRRLEGEIIRDSILAVAGTLNDEMYGPSVPIYLSPFMSMSRRPPRSGPPDGDRRRTVYVEVRRNFLSPMMLAFDMPLPDTTIGRRTRSNIPAQALILMNDPFVVEQAEAWATRLIWTGPANPRERIEAMYQHAFARPPRESELELMLEFVTAQGADYGLSAEEALTDLRVWRDVCHVMFTLKEFIFIG